MGVSALTIGELADRVGMSKSGLFAHFGAKEELQLAVLRAAQERFDLYVVREAFKQPRGAARLCDLFRRWLAWGVAQEAPGGCLIIAAAAEFDDRPGPVRDFLAERQRQSLQGLGRTVQQAIDSGELPPDTDVEQFAFQMFSLILGAHHHVRLLNDQRFYQCALCGLDGLMSAPPRHSGSPAAQ